MTRLRRLTLFVVFSLAVLWAPNLWQRLSADIDTPPTAPSVDAALIFGALVRDGTISPLHAERLDAGAQMYLAGKTPLIVVSNAPKAARMMQEYLLNKGLPPEAVALDTKAPSTPDTCRNEAARDAPKRTVALVSHRFHLPRIRLHCMPFELSSYFVAADDPNRVTAPLITRIRVRSYRFFRENLLTWAVILDLYPKSDA